MKCITSHAWYQLRETYGGGPELPTTAACMVCISDRAAAKAEAAKESEEREAIKSVLDALQHDEEPRDEDFFVSKPWLVCVASRHWPCCLLQAMLGKARDVLLAVIGRRS
jgi:hypothetical protein